MYHKENPKSDYNDWKKNTLDFKNESQSGS